MTKPPVISVRPGPLVPKENSFRAQNLKLIISLAPLMVIWLINNPGLWLFITLALAYGLGQIGQILGRAPQTRDLDPLASSLAALALLGPFSLVNVLLAGLNGALLTVFPGLIKWPGLIGALLGFFVACLGLTLAPNIPLDTLGALLPGVVGLTLIRAHQNPANLLSLAPYFILIPLTLLVGTADYTRLPFVFILAFFGPNKSSIVDKPLGFLAALGALYGGLWGYLGGLVLWGLTGWARPKPIKPLVPIPHEKAFNPNLFYPYRLCLGEEGLPLLIGLAPEPLACRLENRAYACSTACLGLGDCFYACPFGAISLTKGPNKAPIFDRQKCQGCGSCLTACPLGLIKLIPNRARVIIPCQGQETLKAMDKLCAKGCLGCGRCVKACEGQALTRQDFGPPEINHQRCLLWPNCQWACQKACPKGLPVILEHKSN
jgi:ferredoxin